MTGWMQLPFQTSLACKLLFRGAALSCSDDVDSSFDSCKTFGEFRRPVIQILTLSYIGTKLVLSSATWCKGFVV
jgi:hypothetical protein